MDTEQAPQTAPEASPHDPFRLLSDIAWGCCRSRCLHVVAELGVADTLDESARSLTAVASDVGAHAVALGRILRFLAAFDVFSLEDGLVTHTAASRLLQSDHPESMRHDIRMSGLSINWDSFGALQFSAISGQPAATQVHPSGYWEYLAGNPDASAIFNAAMTDKASWQVEGVMASYDFSGFREIGDIGGGHGQLLRTILDSAPAANGVLFDLPHVIADASGIADDRLRLKAGDFFQDELPSCDLYVLMEVIHDWGDAESLAILRAVRRAAQPGATLLLIEDMPDDQPGPSRTKMVDILMLALLGGQQRTLEQYQNLLRRTGFEFQREIVTPSVSILEATAI